MTFKNEILTLIRFLIMAALLVTLIILFSNKAQANVGSEFSEYILYTDVNSVEYQVLYLNDRNSTKDHRMKIASVLTTDNGVPREDFILSYNKDKKLGITFHTSLNNRLTLLTPIKFYNGFSGRIGISWDKNGIYLTLNGETINRVITSLQPIEVPQLGQVDNSNSMSGNLFGDDNEITNTKTPVNGIVNKIPEPEKTDNRELQTSELSFKRVSSQNGYITVETGLMDNAAIYVVGLSGEMIYKGEWHGTQLQIPVQLNSGVYIVMIKYGEHFLTRKIYIQR